MNFHNFVQLDAELFNNRKIKLLRNMPEGDSLVSFWIQLLCIAEKTKAEGDIFLIGNRPYTNQELAIETGYTEEFVENALNQFVDLEMIIRDEVILNIKNWEFYQDISKMD